MTATEVVVELYNSFPELDYIDERDLNENVILFFTGKQDVIKEVMDWCKEADILKYQLHCNRLMILAKEDEAYE